MHISRVCALYALGATSWEKGYLFSGTWGALVIIFRDLGGDLGSKLSFFLSIFTGSLIHELYTRECEFGNFDIKKKKTQITKQRKKKHKNFWLNFGLNKESPKLLCGLGICHRRRQTIPMWNSSGGKGNPQGITVCLVSTVLSTM